MSLNSHNDVIAIGSHKFSTTDIQLANEYVNVHIVPHRLNVLNRSAHVNFDCQRWHVGEFQVCDFSYGDCEVEVQLMGCEKRGLFVVVPLTGHVNVSSEGRHHTLMPGTAMSFTTQDAENTCFHDSTRFRNLNIGTSYDALKQFLANEFDIPITRDVTFVREPIKVSEEFRYLLNYIQWCSSQFENQIETMLLNSPHVARRIQDMLMSLLVSAVQNNYQELYYNQESQSVTPVYVRRAEEYMRAHACEPITVSDVAREVGVATRTLHVGFQRCRNYNVSEFLRNERLSRARQELSTAKQRNLSVTDIAYSCGFLHLSRFAMMYRKRYGEKPSDTLRKGK